MSWNALFPALRSMATADTGAGGLFETAGANTITDFFDSLATEDAAMPYAVVTTIDGVEDDTFANDITTHSVQVSIYTDRLASGTDKGGDIQDRLFSVFHRGSPSVTGFTATKSVVKAQRMLVEDVSYHHITELDITLQKV